MDFGGNLVLKTSPTLVYVQSAQRPFDSVRVILDSSDPDYKDLRDQNDVLSDLIAYRLAPMNVSRGGDTSLRLWGFLASGNYFEALHRCCE